MRARLIFDLAGVIGALVCTSVERIAAELTYSLSLAGKLDDLDLVKGAKVVQGG